MQAHRGEWRCTSCRKKSPPHPPARTVLCRAEVKRPNKECKSGPDHRARLEEKHPYREPTQTYKCLGCKKWFSHKPRGFENRRHPPSLTTMTVTLISIGVSPNMISVLFHNCGWSVHPDHEALVKAVHRIGAYAGGLTEAVFWNQMERGRKIQEVKGTDYWLFYRHGHGHAGSCCPGTRLPRRMAYNATSLLKAARGRSGIQAPAYS